MILWGMTDALMGRRKGRLTEESKTACAARGLAVLVCWLAVCWLVVC